MEITEFLPPETVWVVAAAIIDHEGCVLVQQRPPETSMAGLWEFPGGKVERGESPEAALARELYEELGIGVTLADIPGGAFVTTHVGDRPLILLLYLCRSWHGEPQPLHATALKWCHLPELDALPMPPADVPLVEMLAKLMRPATTPSSSPA